MFDVTVIGAGVVGGMIARRLAAYDLKICIVDKENDVARGATAANSAIVHAGFDAKAGSMKARMNVRGSQMMEQVCAELGVSYKKNGSLVVAFENERAEVEDIYRRGVANGVEGLRIVEKEELFAMEPNLNPDLSCALYAPTGAIVCPYGLTIAAIGNAMDNGAELQLNFEVVGIEKTAEGYTLTAADGRTVETRYLINSAGVYSDEIAKMLGDESFSVHPRRGEYMLLDKECGQTTACTIFHTPTKMGKGVLVSPTVHGNLIVGPTATDMEDKTDTATTSEGFADIRAKAGDNVANVPYGKVITSFCGLRSVGSTGDFIIKAENNAVILGGIESPGLSASPAIAEYIVQMLKEQGLTLTENKNYDPIRTSSHAFREMSDDEKNAYIQKNPDFGKIVCRCENITEGEIRAAVRQNPKALDMDAVKRRVRAGMGRCQGGFCGPKVLEILAREWGCDPMDINKNNPGSHMVTGLTRE